MTGLIRLDPSVEATSTAVTMPRKEFENVWPNKGQCKVARDAAMKHINQMGIGEFIPWDFYENSYFRFHD